MRYPILPLAITFVIAAPCTALAGDKKNIELNDYGFGVSMPVTSTSSGGSIGKRDISSGQATGKRQYAPFRQRSGASGGNPSTGKPPITNQSRQIMPGSSTCTGDACPSPLTATNPALKGNALSPPKTGYDLKANRKM